MTYSKEPLQVKPFRELPQEIMFDLRHAERDTLKPNRYWFKFPENWTLTNDKDRIFGLRSSYISRTQRHIQMTLTCGIYAKAQPEVELIHHTYYIESYIDNDDTIKKFIKDFDEQSLKAYNRLTSNEKMKDIALKIYPNKCRFKYEDNKCIMELYNPVNEIADNEYYVEFFLDSVEYEKKKDLWQMLTKSPYEKEDGEGNKIILCLAWDRYHCYITSSISALNNGGFLSHTDRTNSPIKYYRISSTDDKFWIDLWSTRHHNIPSIMPIDNEDEIILECIVCFDSSAIL